MTVTAFPMQPASYEDTVEYTARQYRNLEVASLLSEGVLTGLSVSERGAGANFSVDVAAGKAVVEGDDEADQGNYWARNDATENVTVTAAPGSNSRLDLVVLQINDPQAGGGEGYDGSIEIVDGTPASSPTLPATPDSAIALAQIGPIDSGTAAITDSLITDLRGFARLTHQVVDTNQLVDDAVTQDKLAANSVGNAQMRDDAVGNAETAFTWTNWNPTVRGDTTPIATTTTHARYCKLGRLVIATFHVRIDESVLGAPHINISLPVTAADANGVKGHGYHPLLSDDDVLFFARPPAGSTTHAYVYIGAGALGSVANGEAFHGQIIYESAT